MLLFHSPVLTICLLSFNCFLNSSTCLCVWVILLAHFSGILLFNSSFYFYCWTMLMVARLSSRLFQLKFPSESCLRLLFITTPMTTFCLSRGCFACIPWDTCDVLIFQTSLLLLNLCFSRLPNRDIPSILALHFLHPDFSQWVQARLNSVPKCICSLEINQMLLTISAIH